MIKEMTVEQKRDAMKMCLAEAGYPDANVVISFDRDEVLVRPGHRQLDDDYAKAVWTAYRLVDSNTESCYNCWTYSCKEHDND